MKDDDFKPPIDLTATSFLNPHPCAASCVGQPSHPMGAKVTVLVQLSLGFTHEVACSCQTVIFQVAWGHQPTSIVLSLPNMFTACARDCIDRFVLSELLFADRAGFGHDVRHNSYLSPRPNAGPDTMHVAYELLQLVG